MFRHVWPTVLILTAFFNCVPGRAQDSVSEMRALIKAQGEKLERQGETLADQQRLIKEQSELLEWHRKVIKAPDSSIKSGAAPELLEPVKIGRAHV